MASISDMRAVLSRAKTTRDELVWGTYDGNIHWDQTAWEESLVRRGYDPEGRTIPEWLRTEPTGAEPDPADAPMVEALDLVIATLQPYENPRRPWKARIW